MREWVELALREGVQWLRLLVELTGAVIVALGVGIAATELVRAIARRQTADFTAIRLVLARYLALALEFRLGADILSTAVAPTWTQIGQLGAIAVIRTALNFFLSREMRDERATSEAERHVTARADLPKGA
jgi:uncharacterized membrane protein